MECLLWQTKSNWLSSKCLTLLKYTLFCCSKNIKALVCLLAITEEKNLRWWKKLFFVPFDGSKKHNKRTKKRGPEDVQKDQQRRIWKKLRWFLWSSQRRNEMNTHIVSFKELLPLLSRNSQTDSIHRFEEYSIIAFNNTWLHARYSFLFYKFNNNQMLLTNFEDSEGLLLLVPADQFHPPIMRDWKKVKLVKFLLLHHLWLWQSISSYRYFSFLHKLTSSLNLLSHNPMMLPQFRIDIVDEHLNSRSNNITASTRATSQQHHPDFSYNIINLIRMLIARIIFQE